MPTFNTAEEGATSLCFDVLPVTYVLVKTLE